MLVVLREWSMTLAGVTVFGAMCEVILPEGSFQKYIRLSIGLLLVFTLLTPLFHILHTDFWPKETEIVEPVYSGREDAEEKQRSDILRLYQKRINQSMTAALKKELHTDHAEVRCDVAEEEEVFGMPTRVSVWLEKPTDAKEAEAIRQFFYDQYEMAKEAVYVQYDGE